jgi:uncharacterized protein YwgA
MLSDRSERQKAADIVRDAGGQIVGRTRFQKVAYLLELAGLGEGFQFEYHHFGPYSEDLSRAIQIAVAFDLISEEEKAATWGGTYSIYHTQLNVGSPDEKQQQRIAFARAAAKIGAVELELAATAAYLHSVEGCEDPWKETAQRKPQKIGDGRLERAK